MRRLAGLAILLVLGAGAAWSVHRLLTKPISPTLAADLAPRDVRGVALTAYKPEDYLLAPAQLERLRAMGARDVQLVPRWLMETKTGTTIAPNEESADDASIRAAIAAAREQGQRVLVKPHVDVADGTYRGQIAPADRAAWWASYRAYVLRYARLAAETRAESFAVGTELDSMVRDEDRWRALIGEVRRAFGGTVLYAANWDGVDRVGFWGALDAIGVDAYFPLAEPTADAWAPIRATLRNLAVTKQLPVVFTEIGYPSQAGATRQPYRETRAAADPQLQARLYEAALTAMGEEPSWAGAWWWDWRVDGTTTPTGYEPAGKPAEAVLRRFWLSPTGRPEASPQARPGQG